MWQLDDKLKLKRNWFRLLICVYMLHVRNQKGPLEGGVGDMLRPSQRDRKDSSRSHNSRSYKHNDEEHDKQNIINLTVLNLLLLFVIKYYCI